MFCIEGGTNKLKRYEKIAFLGEGQFATVYKARDIETDTLVAVKKIKIGSVHEARDGINRTALREIKLLQEIDHPNIIGLLDVFGYRSNVSLVFDYMDTDLEVIIKDSRIIFSTSNIKAYTLMTLLGLEYLHDNWILHRDLKPNNLLVNKDGVLKIGDFGLAKTYGSPNRIYTHQVVTRWYRSPELLFGCKKYGIGVDMWAVGCIVAELLLRVPFLPGESDIDQLTRIFQVFGSPTEETWPGLSGLQDYVQFKPFPVTSLKLIFTAAPDDLIDLLEALLQINPLNRTSCKDALKMPYFSNRPPPSKGNQLPFPTSLFATDDTGEPNFPSRKRKHSDSPQHGAVSGPHIIFWALKVAMKSAQDNSFHSNSFPWHIHLQSLMLRRNVQTQIQTIDDSELDCNSMKLETSVSSQKHLWDLNSLRRMATKYRTITPEDKICEFKDLSSFTLTDWRNQFLDGEVCLLKDSPFRILRAAESGNLEDFNRLYLADNTRLSVRDSKGRAPAHQAAARNRVAILQFIKNHGGDLNIQDAFGNTPLHVAIENEAFDAINFLLDNDVDTSIQNNKKQAPLHLAAEHNKVSVLKSMAPYANKFNPHQGGEHGRTALHLAAIYDYADCAHILITEYGAKTRQPCNNGYYPIHEAAKNASSHVMEVFLQWGESCGNTREQMISFFDAEGNVPLHSAIHSGDFKAVELCLKSGAKISTQQHDMSTPVHLACSQGAIDIVKLMFSLQPEEKMQCLSSCDIQKMTPLHCAAMFNRAELVKYLINEGADMNALDKENRSPLLLAASRSGWQTVKTLVQLGANIHLKDSSHRNILHLIVTRGGNIEEFAECIRKAHSIDSFKQLLDEKNNKGYTPLHCACEGGYIKSLESLIKYGACINLRDNNKETPLHLTAWFGRINILKKLLDSEKGSFIINECNGEGLTPLHIASKQGHTSVVQMLLDRGALLHRDHNGRNPLHLAAMAGCVQTMELLHSVHSHLLDQVDKDKNTALHLATMENQPSAISLLLSMNCKLLANSQELSAIDYAIYYKFPEAALAMVIHETRGEEVMALKSDKHPCVTLALIASMPKVFVAVQDKCISKANCKKDSKLFYIRYNFSCLECPTELNSSSTGALPKPEPLPALNAMVTHGRVELLAHPLSQKYLEMKWNSYGKYFNIMHLLLYTIFLILVTFFSSNLMSYNEPVINATASTSLENMELAQRTPFMFLSALIILVYIGLNIIREFIQFYQQTWQYLLDPTNIVYILLYVSTIVLLTPAVMPPTIFKYSAELQISCASITVFLSWFTLLLNLQRFDHVGIYVVMFLEILQTLIKVLIVFFILIVAFGLAFYILLSRGNHLAFSTVPMSVMRTFAMMLGEIDFLGTYVYPYYNVPEEHDSKTLPFPLSVFCILGVFMVLMPILLMNLLIGLAVGDIESVKRNAKLKRLAMQVLMHSELERKLPKMLLEKIDKKELIEYPNERKTKLNFLDFLLRVWFYHSFADEGIEHVLERKEDGEVSEFQEVKFKLKTLCSSLDKQRIMLRMITEKMGIKPDCDEIDEVVLSDDLPENKMKPRLRYKLQSTKSMNKSLTK